MKMDHADQVKLIEESLRRDLTPAEESALLRQSADPEAAKLDLHLSQALRRLPDAPVASNFTAVVLAQIQKEASPAAVRPWLPSIFGWRPVLLRAGLAMLLVAAGLFSHQQVQRVNRLKIASSIVPVAEAAELFQTLASSAPPKSDELPLMPPMPPLVEFMEDFEAIQRLSEVPEKIDFELLLALQ